MRQEVNDEQPRPVSNERAVAWARQMMARKRATQKRMAEEYKTNYKLQAALAKLHEENVKSDNDAEPRPYKFISYYRENKSNT